MTTETTTAIRKAAAAALRQVMATTARDEAIKAASTAGASLREIAEATRLSHMSVKRIVDRIDAPGSREVSEIP
jgi:DNA-binding NarL/FixJ family response regulator